MLKKIATSFAIAISTLCFAQVSIIPKPNKVFPAAGYFEINSETALVSNEKNSFNLTYLHSKLSSATGYKFSNAAQSGNFIRLILSPVASTPKEGYLLTIAESGIEIESSSEAGIFYGIQSLLQMLPPTVYSGKAIGNEKWTLPCLTIEDSPRYSYRGMMLDVSRTFFDAETVKRYIDNLAYHKINTFHWHLTDDNGWRVEIKKYPLLTEKGAWRGENEVLKPSFGSGNERYGGYYTQEQIKEIVAYAAQRHIEIIPEIELPGHSRAITATYPQVACDHNHEGLARSVQGEENNVWCVGEEQNYKMLEDIIKELAALFPSKYIHIGGDEVNFDHWLHCPKCLALIEKEGMEQPVELHSYFVRRMEEIIAKYGKIMAGWDEILDGKNLKPESRVYAWRNIDKGIEAITKGQPTIFQPAAFCYIDMKQSPLERGHNWAGIVTLEKTYSLDPEQGELTQQQKDLIVGVQGGLWAELLQWPPRFLDYQAFPRMCAISEVGWTQPENKSFPDFEDRTYRYHYDRMYNMGIAFRIPPPVVTYEDGALNAQLPFPWAVVRYTADESEPTHLSPAYKDRIYTDNPVKFRFATFYNNEFKSISVKAENVEYHYLAPETEIESSITENPRFPLSNTKDYKFNTYFRSAGTISAGDYLTYKFKEPVACTRITVETGIPNITFYGITDGYAEYSYDGINFIKAAPMIRGTTVIYPEMPVLAVRIVATAPNDGYILALQDLRIE
jgi:N-acetyl-beta-hexosaminidase